MKKVSGGFFVMKKFKSTAGRAREVLDSRGYPTVEAEVEVVALVAT